MLRLHLLVILAFCGISSRVEAQGNLLITPMRVVFDGKAQKETLYLVNRGNDTTTFSISFVNYLMREDGSFVAITHRDSVPMNAVPYLRIFPRQVTLAPNESQTVLLQLRKSAAMEPGEYRSHIYFRSETDYAPVGMSSSEKSDGVSIRLSPIYGICIPVIIRTGAVNVKATISDARIENASDTSRLLRLTINRTGNISTYGDLTVYFVSDRGREEEVGSLKGVGIYTTTPRRLIAIPLKHQKIENKNGKLRVVYVDKSGRKEVVYAESELVI